MERIYGLTCNGQEYCLNASGDLYFAWKLSSCELQKSFLVKIYDGDKEIFSGGEKSSKQAYIAQNLRLTPFKEYSYTVEVKTDCFTEVSARAYFRAGVGNCFGKQAKWISNGTHFVEENEKPGTPAQYFEKTFNLPAIPKSAIVNVCGLGLYELYINGKRVGDRVLEPAFTDYNKRILYSTYEVASLLKEGENLIDVIVGDGWFNQTTKDTWGFFRASWRDCPKLIFRMDIDGETTVVSDGTWKVSYGELISNALRVGEFYDYTTQRNYTPAVLTTPPGGELSPAFLPPIRECEELLPIKIIEGPKCRIYDFGKNIAGYCKVVFAGKRGDLAYVEYSDRVVDGKIDNASNSMYIFNSSYYQKDGCKLGEGLTEYKPKFTYHGFRYVAIYTEAEVLDIKAYFVHTDVERIGNFNCSSERLNTLYDMSMNSILSNYHGFPTDCPHREKNGWTGDAQLSLEASIYNFNMHYAYKKWLDDFIDCQLLTGQISAIIPTCGWGYNWGSGPAWDIAFFRITRALKKYYGDTATAKKIYPYLKKYYDYISSYAVGELLCVGLGDWNYPKTIKFDVCPTELTDSCYRKLMADILAEFAEEFEPSLIEFYKQEALNISSAILRKYASEASLTGMAALDYFGIANRTEQVCKYLENNNCSIHFGILGCKFVLDCLGRCGRSDLGLKMLEKGDYPSFGYWAENGQTALCEDFEMTNSLNHHMYSPIAEYMTRYILGIEIEDCFHTFTVKPNLPKGLTKAENIILIANGKLKIKAESLSHGVRLSLSVPANVTVKYNDKYYSSGEYVL